MLQRREISGYLGGFLVLVGLAAASGLVAAETEPGTADPELQSPVVATVDGEPVFDVEIDRFIAFGFAPAPDTEPALGGYRRAVLERVIDARLRAREVERLGIDELPAEEVDAAVASVRHRFATREDFEARLEELDLEAGELRRLFEAEILARLFVKERLDPRLLIDPERLRIYYETVVVPDARAAGEQLPSFDETSLTARRRAEERLVREELESWTAELRERAAIELLVPEVPPRELER